MEIKQVTRGNLIIKRLDDDTVPDKDKQIILVKTKKQVRVKGTVIAVGAPATDKWGKEKPFNVRAGDTVYFNRYSGKKFTIRFEDFVLLKQEDVVALRRN